jgi:hypothetical protein
MTTQTEEKIVLATDVGRMIAEVTTDKRVELTKEEAKLLMAMMFSAKEAQKSLGSAAAISEKLLSVLEGGFLGKIMQARCRACGLEAEAQAKIFLAALCDRPGTVVMYAALLRHMMDENVRNGEPALVTLDQLCYDPFAMGQPNQEELQRIWDAQKRCGPRPAGTMDNWLDAPEAWGINTKKGQNDVED